MNCSTCGNAVSADCINHATAQVTDVLNDVYKPEGVRIWLQAKQVRFGGRTALQMIADGHGDEVLSAAKSLT